MKERGQVILLLILIMTVALAIGLSIVQKSLVDISTSSKVEQSSRAFSAAEAGVEKALQNSNTNNNSSPDVLLDNNSIIKPVKDTRFPQLNSVNQQDALEYPPIAKEDIAQVWLSDPAADLPLCRWPVSMSPSPAIPPVCYRKPGLDVYWGDPAASDKAALEVTLIYYGIDAAGDLPKYRSHKWYLDSVPNRGNGFEDANCFGNNQLKANYFCKKTLDLTSFIPSLTKSNNELMLIRARLLYNNTSQPFAVQPPSNYTCGSDCSIPSQAREIISTGTSGDTQRKVKLFQEFNVVPSYFDYAIFSAGGITK